MHGFLSAPQMEDKEPSHGLQEKLIPKMLNFGNLDLWPVLLLLVVEGSPHSFSSVQNISGNRQTFRQMLTLSS